MTNDLVVLIGDHVAGLLSRSEKDRTVLNFEYDDDYRMSGDATPISLSIPLQAPSHASSIVTPWLWGLLPDNPAVLERWSRSFQISSTSPFAFLATPIGEDCAGAVRFVAPDRLEAALQRDSGVEWLTEDDVEARLRDLRMDSTAWLGHDLTGQFSLAGAQAKTALLHQNGRWGLPHGDLPTSHILKPAIVGFDEHDLNEHLCLTVASACGLVAAGSSLVRFGDERAVVVERFDRCQHADGRVQRIHQEDLCQALGVSPARKYQSEGGPSSTDIMTLLDTEVNGPARDEDRLRFADAIVYNWLIGGTDAHAKNYALLLAGPDVRLAPLYDIGSALPYPGMQVRKLRLAMKLGGSYLLSGGGESWWHRAATELDLPLETISERVRDLGQQLPDAFVTAAAQPAIAELGSTLPARLADAVALRVKECVRWAP